MEENRQTGSQENTKDWGHQQADWSAVYEIT